MDYKDRIPTEEEINKSMDRFRQLKTRLLINALGELNIMDMYAYYQNIVAANDNKLSDDLEQYIRDFVNIYGYIYKNGRGRGRNHPFEIREYGEYGKEKGSIKQGTNFENFILGTDRKKGLESHLIKRIFVKLDEEVPMIVDEDSVTQNDIICVLPFTTADQYEFMCHFSGADGTITTFSPEHDQYKMTLKKQGLPEIEGSKLEEIKRGVIEQFATLEGKSQIHLRKDLSNMREQRGRKKQNGRDTEIEKLFYGETNPNEFRNKFLTMLKALCRQRERDIDQQIEDEKKREAEKENRRQEAIWREQEKKWQERLQEQKTTICQNMRGIVSTTNDNYTASRNILQALNAFSTTQNYENYIYSILSDESDIIKYLNETPSNSVQSYREVAQLVRGDLQTNTDQLAEELIGEAKAKLNEETLKRIKEYINNATKEYMTTLKEPKGLLGRLTGEKRLIEAIKDNARARADLVISTLKDNNTENSTHKMLINMGCCVEFVKSLRGAKENQFPEEFQEIKDIIERNFGINEDRVEKQVKQTIQKDSSTYSEPTLFPTTKGIGVFRRIANRNYSRRILEGNTKKVRALNEKMKPGNSSTKTKIRGFEINPAIRTMIAIRDTLKDIKRLIGLNTEDEKERFQEPQIAEETIIE